MSSQDFLDSFRRKLPRGTAPDRAKVKEALDYVFGLQRNTLDKYRPDQNQTRDFVDYLIFAIREEDKLLTKDRCLALTKILDYNERPGAPKFAGIDPHVFAFQLALRIREPSLINQKGLGICGANSLMHYFAKNTPSAFAQYSISLIRNGWGQFHGLPVEARTTAFGSAWEKYKTKTLEAKNEYGQREEPVAEVDFVTMASFDIDFFGSPKEGLWDDEMCKRLSQAGFRNVQNKVTPPGGDTTKQNFDDACTAVAAGKLVFLCVWPEFVRDLDSYKRFLANRWESPYLRCGSGKKWEHALTGGGGLDLAGDGFRAGNRQNPNSRHWILVTYLTKTDPTVTIKLYSWGSPVQGTLLLSTFMTHYQGYVAADPPQFL